MCIRISKWYFIYNYRGWLKIKKNGMRDGNVKRLCCLIRILSKYLKFLDFRIVIMIDGK